MSNNSGNIPVQTRFNDAAARMAAYDSLPAEYRKLLQDAPFNLNFECIRYGVEEYAVTIAEIQRDATLATYGANHPALSEA